jgi:hypothetical protein
MVRPDFLSRDWLIRLPSSESVSRKIHFLASEVKKRDAVEPELGVEKGKIQEWQSSLSGEWLHDLRREIGTAKHETSRTSR